jgi:hypothetical protein
MRWRAAQVKMDPMVVFARLLMQATRTAAASVNAFEGPMVQVKAKHSSAAADSMGGGAIGTESLAQRGLSILETLKSNPAEWQHSSIHTLSARKNITLEDVLEPLGKGLFSITCAVMEEIGTIIHQNMADDLGSAYRSPQLPTRGTNTQRMVDKLIRCPWMRRMLFIEAVAIGVALANRGDSPAALVNELQV